MVATIATNAKLTSRDLPNPTPGMSANHLAYDPDLGVFIDNCQDFLKEKDLF